MTKKVDAMWVPVDAYTNEVIDGYVGKLEGKPNFVTSVSIEGEWAEPLLPGDIFVIGKESNLTKIRIKSVKYHKRDNITSIYGDDLRFAK